MSSLRIWLVASIVAILTSCASVQKPESVSFEATPTSVVEGETAVVSWKVIANDPSRYKVTLDGRVVAASGTFGVTPSFPSQQYWLIVYNGDSLVQSTSTEVRVTKRETKPVINQPITEEVNNTPSKFATGVINAESKIATPITATVFGVDLRDFPNKVRVLVSVRDGNGNLVANLAPPYSNQHDDFWKSVSEDHAGNNVEIEKYTVTEVRATDAKPKTVCFVGDYSGSMSGSIDALDEAIEYGMGRLRTGDDYCLVQFDHNVYEVGRDIQGGTITTRIPFDQLGGATAFYQASRAGLAITAQSSKERVAILFTDGEDNSSLFSSASDVASAAFGQSSRTFVIAYGGANRGVLSQIASNANGKYYEPTDESELEAIYEEIFRTLDVHYVIEYEGKKLGKDHNVRVTIQPPTGQPYTAVGSYVEQPKPILENRAYVAGMFKSGKAQLDDAKRWKKQIDELVQLATQYPEKEVVIRAHTDTRGNEKANERLSVNRAKIIARELERRGVTKKRIRIEGKGESAPLHPSDQEDWQQRENRRVEVFFV